MIFLTSDQHFDHINIIKYCNRPFATVDEMNKIMLGNWNNTIKSSDTVFFLGDLAFGRGSRTTDYWLDQLKGKITFIKGSHDRSKKIPFLHDYILEYGEYKFLLVHQLIRTQYPRWKGWVIHGHTHDKEPFFNKDNKTFNVSVDVTKWGPVNIDDIVKKIEETKDDG
jgi:calcineurin-like phosphoesterase family protein